VRGPSRCILTSNQHFGKHENIGSWCAVPSSTSYLKIQFLPHGKYCFSITKISKVKVKLSLYRSCRPLGLREVEVPTFSNTRLIDGGKVVSFTRRRPLRPGRPGRFLVLISVRGWVDPGAIVRLEGLGKLKNPHHPGLEPATFRLVV
jgi:hypothetical protein